VYLLAYCIYKFQRNFSVTLYISVLIVNCHYTVYGLHMIKLYNDSVCFYPLKMAKTIAKHVAVFSILNMCSLLVVNSTEGVRYYAEGLT
jgi:hypothetical protein